MYRLFIAAGFLFASSAWANEAQIRKAVEPKLSEGSKIEGIQPGPIAGLFEVRVRGSDGSVQILYADATGGHIKIGRAHV